MLLKLWKGFILTDIRVIETPLQLNVHYVSSDGVPLSDPSLCQTQVGSLWSFGILQ